MMPFSTLDAKTLGAYGQAFVAIVLDVIPYEKRCKLD